MPLHCPHCGTEVSDDARYCMRCGRERPQPQYVPPVPLDAMETATATPTNPHPAQPTPTPVPTPTPAPRTRNPALVWTATLAAAFVIGGGATAGVLLLSDDDGGGAGKAAPQSQDDKPAVTTSTRPTASATATSSSSPTTTPESAEPTKPSKPTKAAKPTEPTEAPLGFRRVTDPVGFSLAVPDVWSRTSAHAGQITYAGSTGMEHLLIGVVHNPPYSSSYENFLALEKNAKATQKDFQRLRLERNTFQGRPGAIWEYTFTDKQTGETLHAIDQGYIAPNGTDYSIYTKARDRDWQYARKIFDTALSTWTLG